MNLRALPLLRRMSLHDFEQTQQALERVVALAERHHAGRLPIDPRVLIETLEGKR